MGKIDVTDIFKKIELKEIESRISKRKVENDLKVMMWQKGSSRYECFVVSRYDSNSKCFIMSIGGEFSLLTDKSSLFHFIIDDQQYFSTGKVTRESKELNRYDLKLANDIFRCEKRKNFRLPLGEKHSLELQIKDVIYDGIDISVGGIKIAFLSEELNNFSEGQGFTSITVHFNEKKFIIPFCKVVHIEEDENTGRYLAGIEFLEFDESTESALFREVNEALYQYLK